MLQFIYRRTAPRKIGAKAIFNNVSEVIWGRIGRGSVEHEILKETRDVIHGS